MQLTEFLDSMSPQVYKSLKQALELGRWPNGEKMTQEQRDASLQAIIVYEHKHLPEAQRVGYMPQKCKSGESVEKKEETILRFKDA